jgi:preprotein translocase subunit YajC
VTSALVSLADAPPGGSSAVVQFLPLILIFGVFWFLVIRPQQKKGKLHQEMLSQLHAGDVVVTQGGIIGKITGIKDLEVTIEVQQGVRLKLLRTHISNKYTPGEAAKADAKAS